MAQPVHRQIIAASELDTAVQELKHRALVWAKQFRQVALFEGNNVPYPHSGFRNLLGISTEKDGQDHFSAGLQRKTSDEMPLLGYLTYDLKNRYERLSSQNPDFLNWPEQHFFVPEILIEWLNDGSIEILSRTLSPDQILKEIRETPIPDRFAAVNLNWTARTPKETYLSDVQAIRQHIEEGDVYELNYCQEFYAEAAQFDSVQAYQRLMQVSPMPFSGFLKLDDRYLVCASPERFLKKTGSELLSQPIKGTAKRGATPAEDEANKLALQRSEKERAENMMIVDLVRNDLSRCCQIGSVKVDELFGIYSFPFVHQMISTIKGTLKPEFALPDALAATFPMGSMTGAPKIMAMHLIEQYEKVKRGLFSGSIGFVFPDGSADFNVVIRSLQYNQKTGYLSYQVGSAITYDSDPEQEYDECLMKAAGIMKALGN